ncbi:MAG: hypothetical protein Q8R35_00345 [bacterium]|nr:hypothetical protein [bacterium]
MARTWYAEADDQLWRVSPDAAGSGEPPQEDEDLIPVCGGRDDLEPRLGFDEIALYERQDGTTNVRRGPDARRTAKRWRYSRDHERFVWLVGPPSSLGTELTALEVNEIAGQVVVAVPCSAR